MMDNQFEQGDYILGVDYECQNDQIIVSGEAQERPDYKPDCRPEVSGEAQERPEFKPDCRPEVSGEAQERPECKPDCRPEVSGEAQERPECKPDCRPEVSGEAQERPECKPEASGEAFEQPEFEQENTFEDVDDALEEDVEDETDEIEKYTEIKKVKCTTSGKITLTFANKVKYTEGLCVFVTNENGTEIECTIVKKNKKSIDIVTKGLVNGQNYTITVDGLLVEDSTNVTSVSKTFCVKGIKTSCKIKKVNVSKKYVTLSLKCSAYYKNASVEVTDSEGNVMKSAIVKKTKGKIKIKVKGMVSNKTYTVKINGVKTKKEKNYSSIQKTFAVK